MARFPRVSSVDTAARGTAVFHHGRVWHGSGPNASDAEFVPGMFAEGTGPIYARYRRLGDTAMDENYFPVTWRRDGYRTPGIASYLAQPLAN